jgi:hypothetical protein
MVFLKKNIVWASKPFMIIYFAENSSHQKKGFHALDEGLNFFSKDGILSHLSYISCLDDGHDILNDLVEPTNPLFLKGENDNGVEENMELYHEVYCSNIVYTNPIQSWIEDACSGACHFLREFDHGHEFMFYSSHSLMEILACIYFTFDVSLFWMVTKHKGRSHGIYERIKWLH